MHSYRIIFSVNRMTNGGIISAGHYIRIIRTGDEEMAGRIAEAMIDEPIQENGCEWLSEVRSIEITRKEYGLASLRAEKTWSHVLQKLNISLEDVQWLLDFEGEIIGLSLTGTP